MKNSIEQLLKDNPCCCDTKSNKVAEEKGRRFEIVCKKKNYLKVHIDNGLIKDSNDNKCDYLFIRDYTCEENKTEFYFVELKGSDIEKAFNQIEESITEVKKKHIKSLPKEKIRGFIVCSKVRPQINQLIKIKKDKFKKTYGKEIDIKSNQLFYTPE